MSEDAIVTGSDQGVLAGGAPWWSQNCQLEQQRAVREKHETQTQLQEHVPALCAGHPKNSTDRKNYKEHVALNREFYFSVVLLMLKRVRWSGSSAVIPRLSS